MLIHNNFPDLETLVAIIRSLLNMYQNTIDYALQFKINLIQLNVLLRCLDFFENQLSRTLSFKGRKSLLMCMIEVKCTRGL